ncbi:DNA polymerase Y family protein [Compostimonas suwonensis]|uniref:Protein ImuB n=1 Tax=Compostimonas suwonensis TaxID=1048394 RepID=A0A2M9BB06_9MICO|nr:DNA polymerase Y family protein [Compostimonas suwonensis]PJJ55128.1 protein ImuB [Compostimonas suwonensis]
MTRPGPSSSGPPRTLALWCPDWPVTAALSPYGTAHDLVAGSSTDVPIALVDRGEVFACSPAARREGVARGLRMREAQSRCSGLLVIPYDETVDNRAFEPVLAAIEEVVPGVQVMRPGSCVMRAQGPARYYGGERAAADRLLDRLEALGVAGARIGIADGLFAALQAARRPEPEPVFVVPGGESPAFLAPLPVRLLDRPELTTLLGRLGIHTLGDFAALSSDDVLDRFGGEGARLHALASGADGSAVVARTVPAELDRGIRFEPPLDRVDQVTFAVRQAADRFLDGLTAATLVCTTVRLEIETESGELSQRSWMHPRSFTAADVVDRVRWQLQGAGSSASELRSGIVAVRIVPESVDAIGNHEPGLWGGAADERIHHALSRVQSMLGHGAVLTAALGGGRTLAERQNLVPWGDRALLAAPGEPPWPGRLPPPLPGTLFETPRAARVLAADGSSVAVDSRGALTAEPAVFRCEGSAAARSEDMSTTPSPSPAGAAVTAWAGPWPLEERWWDDAHRSVHHLQLVDAEGTAWLLLLDDGAWFAEARYD